MYESMQTESPMCLLTFNESCVSPPLCSDYTCPIRHSCASLLACWRDDARVVGLQVHVSPQRWIEQARDREGIVVMLENLPVQKNQSFLADRLGTVTKIHSLSTLQVNQKTPPAPIWYFWKAPYILHTCWAVKWKEFHLCSFPPI